MGIAIVAGVTVVAGVFGFWGGRNIGREVIMRMDMEQIVELKRQMEQNGGMK